MISKILFIMIAILTYSNASYGVVKRHDVSEKLYEVSKPPSFIIDMPGDGHGVLIASQWVITAAHTTFLTDRGKKIRIGNKDYEIDKVVIHPGDLSAPSHLNKGDAKPLIDFLKRDKDIALLKLTTKVTGVKPIQLYRDNNEQGKIITGYGKGATGNGLTGAQMETRGSGVMNKFSNVINKVSDKWLFYQFDNSVGALPLEGMSGSGDSGGPAIIVENNTPYLAGLHSWHTYEGDLSNYQSSLYGQSGAMVRISYYKDWIQGEMSSSNDALDDYILTQMSESDVQGIQLTIVKNEKVIKVANYGVVKDNENINLNSTEIGTWIITLQKDSFFEQHSNLNSALNCPSKNKSETSKNSSACVIDWKKSVRTDHPVIKGKSSDQLSLSVYPKDNLSIVLLGDEVSSIPENFADEIASFYVPTMKVYSGYALVKYVKSLWRELEVVGYENTHSVAVKLQKTHQFTFEESHLQGLGYLLLEQNKLQQAAHVFELNCRLYPESANTFYDLGEAYSELKLSQQAINSYEKSFKLNPGYESFVKDKIEKLREKSNI
jgi:tetratricopeptide (TPR) repeat protein